MREETAASHYNMNLFGVSSVEFFWGLALPVLFESTFFQIFLKSIGSSNRTIGLIPAFLSSGVMIFGIAAAYITSHLEKKRKAVIITHALASLPVILFGILFPFIPASYKVTLFIACYIIFSMLLGLTLPVWQNFLVKIFEPGTTIRALSIMMTVQMTARFLGSLMIFKVVDLFAFSTYSTSAVFIIAGIMMFAGSFMFYFITEHQDNTYSTRYHHSIKSMFASARSITHNRNYMMFMYSFIESHATIAVLSFYANFAVEHRGINSATAAGLFAAVIYAASFTSNIMFGWLNILSLKGKITAARISSITGTLILLCASNIQMFIAASFLFGISRGVNQFAYAPGVKMLSGAEDTTDYFAISSVLIFPFAFGIPYFSGLLLDITGGGNASFILVFCILLVFQVAGLAAVILAGFESEVKG